MGHLLAVSSGYSVAGAGAVGVVVDLVLYVITGIGLYGTFAKAGQPGWAGFVPIYNIYILLKVAGRPTWWTWFILLPLVTFFVPVVYILAAIFVLVVSIFVLNDTSRSFGHGGGFTVGLVLLPFVFFNILGYDQNRYLGPAGPEGNGLGSPSPMPATGNVPAGGWSTPSMPSVPSAQAPPPPPPPPVTPPPPPPTAGHMPPVG
jgi:uncharacterized protein DUF5684